MLPGAEWGALKAELSGWKIVEDHFFLKRGFFGSTNAASGRSKS